MENNTKLSNERLNRINDLAFILGQLKIIFEYMVDSKTKDVMYDLMISIKNKIGELQKE